MGMKRLLHAGCGSRLNKPPREFSAYKEMRLDCNSQVEPDIVASIVAMPMIEDQSFDAIYASHVLEHLFAHEVAMALREFERILKPGGSLLIHVPDLQSIGGRLALDQADCIAYQSAVGPVTPLDMIYGRRGAVGQGDFWMAHKTGFTSSVLKSVLGQAGFVSVEMNRDAQFELVARGKKQCQQNQKPSADICTPDLEAPGFTDTTSQIEASCQPA